MSKPRLLDLFCGAGGAAMGYHRAGFEVVGVDIKPQPHYPFEFHQGDALAYPLDGFDVYHASPPCQPYSRIRPLLIAQKRARQYESLIESARALLAATALPYVMENVCGSPLQDYIQLCGSAFGLKIERHRWFESNIALFGLQCSHYWQGKEPLPPLHRLQGSSRVVGCYGHGRGKGDNVALWREALGITWMTRAEMAEAIPPAYTEYIGRQLMRQLGQP